MPGPGEFQAVISDEMLAPILTKASSEMEAQLGVDSLDDALTAELNARVTEAVQAKFGETLQKVAAGVAQSAATVAPVLPTERINAGLIAGADHVRLIAEHDKYHEMLAQTAAMTFAKYSALIGAGFSKDQAFRLVEAETLAKAGRK